MKYADLHIHTTASDGILGPAEIVKWAYEEGLSTIAITDHDTVSGVGEAVALGEEIGVEVIPGIELGTYVDSHEVHILGYYIDYEAKWFQEKLEGLRQWRNIRAQKLIENLRTIYNIDICIEAVKEIAGDAAIGRPHIGRMLVELGLVSDLKEAFDRYIGSDCPAYVPRQTLSPEEGIDLIKAAGGIPVLAHPGLIGERGIIDYVIDMGIEGIEVFHPSHTPEEEGMFVKLSRQEGLLILGGSDFHDVFNNNSPAMGQKKLHYSHVEKLRVKAKTIRSS